MLDRYESFTVTILKIHRAIQKIKSEEMAEYNLKIHHVSCIYYLFKEGSLTATELRDICGEDKAYISHSLKYLEENGYISCSSNAKKRYNAPFSLTEKGLEIGSHVAGKIDAVLEPAGEGMDDTEREVFYRCLNLISNNLEQICEKYTKNN